MDKFLNVLVEGNLDVFVWVIILVAVLIIGALLGALGTYFLAKEKVKKATSNAEKIINDDYKLIFNSDYSVNVFDIKNNRELKTIPKNFEDNIKEEIKYIKKEIPDIIKNFL